jgi:hypothetical protein
MATKAKFRCTGRHELCSISGGEVTQVDVTMQAVYDDGANGSWSKWTPSGELRMSVTNPEAFKQYVLGKAYFLTLELAE